MSTSHLPTTTSDSSTALSTITAEAAYGYPAQESPKLRRAIAAVLRYKWLVLLITGVGTAAGVFGSQYLPKRYSANATLWIEVRDQNQNRQAQGPIQSPELLQEFAWLELLRSHTVMDHVVTEHRLYLQHQPADAPIFAGFGLDTMAVLRPGKYRLAYSAPRSMVELRNDQDLVVDRAAAGEPLGARLGFDWVPPADVVGTRGVVEFTVMAPRDAAQRLNGALDASMRAQRANFISLKFSSGSPAQAATVLNAIAERFVDIAAELKRAKLRELRDILERQLLQAETKLREAELALESFRVQTITLPSEAATPVTPGLESTRADVVSRFFNLKIARDQLLHDRDAIVRSLAAGAEDGLALDALAVVEAVRQSTELSATLQQLAAKRASLRALRQEYTDEDIRVRRALAETMDLERRVIPQQAQQVIADLEQRATLADEMVTSASTELREIPPRAIEEARYQRTVEIAENIYNDLRQRYENARLATETTVRDVRVLELATVPFLPDTDTRLPIMLFVAAASFGFAVLLALILDRVDPRLRYAEQVTHGLQLPIVGAVPYVGSAKQPADQLHAQEALRALRLCVSNAYGAAGPMVLAVTSPGPADGKTFITANLATSYADLGLRVLVVDGDTRRGDLHRVLGANRRPGLTDLLAGTMTLPQVIQPTNLRGVHIIGGGTRRSSAPELLSSARMGDLLAGIRPAYDVILIDSPPLVAGVDPLVLATLAGNLLLVIRTGKTDRVMAEAKLEMLDRLPVRLLGVVLNGVPAGGEYRYYSYMPGYEASDEDAEALQPALTAGSA